MWTYIVFCHSLDRSEQIFQRSFVSLWSTMVVIDSKQLIVSHLSSTNNTSIGATATTSSCKVCQSSISCHGLLCIKTKKADTKVMAMAVSRSADT
jgi:hypothetical protein